MAFSNGKTQNFRAQVLFAQTTSNLIFMIFLEVILFTFYREKITVNMLVAESSFQPLVLTLLNTEIIL